VKTPNQLQIALAPTANAQIWFRALNEFIGGEL
jgi:hypothetical protein